MTKRRTDPGEPRDDRPGEEWKPIPGFKGIYEISSFGRVYRLNRAAVDGSVVRSRMLKASVNNGYRVTYLADPTKKSGHRHFYIEPAIANLFPHSTIASIQPDRDGDLLGEEWRDIPGYEGLYQASSFGRVASIARQIGDSKQRWRSLRRRIRQPGRDRNGYAKVELARAGDIRTVSVHRLIALAFIPNPAQLPFVNHKDNDGMNNRPENLEWVTRGDNVRHWFNGAHFLTEEIIKLIIDLYGAGKSPAEILAALPKRKRRTGGNGEG